MIVEVELVRDGLLFVHLTLGRVLLSLRMLRSLVMLSSVLGFGQ